MSSGAEAVATTTGVSQEGHLSEYGCEHYRRRCKIVAPCCGEIFWCRHCHNAEKEENEPDPARRHKIDRFAVSEVVCAVCETRQPVNSNCITCGVLFGNYYCLSCKLFDDDTSKQQFHCEHCGSCRVGGRGNYFHCSICNCCYHVDMQDSHVCVVNSMHQNCPVCWEYLFESTAIITVLNCGHTIHRDCLKQLVKHNGKKCPVCAKSLMDMSRNWRTLDNIIASTPMPPEYRDYKVSILCNDCQNKSQVSYHVYGHKCQKCGSYNTARF